MSSAAAARAALRLRVTGIVQGVGFRPFVHRLAVRHELAGWVRNTAGDVRIAVEGGPESVAAFLRELTEYAPPLARIHEVETESTRAEGRDGFEILGSADEPNRFPPVPPDVTLCAACEAELFDPANRRFRYPFITCTDCGPRYSVIEAMPFDRERTSMRLFACCEECRREYDSPGNRRHHSETNSCPACGPTLWFAADAGGRREAVNEAALAAAATLLAAGGILAVRGLGGFHLAVDATCESAVRRLRERKGREAKPFAVMVRTPLETEAVCALTATERELLMAAQRPVVLATRHAAADVAPSVAPGLTRIGLFLAYTPIHHLLLDLVRRPLVMTSGNRSEEPLAFGNAEALERLGVLGDGFLLHDREIVAPVDDSVVRACKTRPILLRRARGLAPSPLELPVATPRPIVAVGPHLKSTFTLAAGARAFVSPHLGDLESLEALERFQAVLQRYRELFRIDPEVAARDLHPGYLSTRIAEEMGLRRIVAVQHHHAHVAAVLAEHGEPGPAVGLAFDGTGYGDDGTIWGGEVLLADLCGYRRLGSLRPAPLPGGDAAVRAPWRAALGYLSLEPTLRHELEPAFEGVRDVERAAAERQLARRLNAPLASSMGRLFDAAAAVLGVRRVSQFEGQAAMELEALAEGHAGPALPFPVTEDEHGALALDPVPLLAALSTARRQGEPTAALAAAFHAAVARAAGEAALRACEIGGVATVVLSGGVFQNALLLGAVVEWLGRRGARVLVPRELGPNDGAISFGQAAVAAALLASER